MKKKILKRIILSCVLLMTVGCGKDQESKQKEAAKGEKAKVTFWAASASAERNEFFEGFAKRVSEVYPDITVEYLGVPGNNKDYNQKLNMAIAAGEAPDITNDFRADLIERGFYEPLDSYFENWDKKEEVLEEALAGNRRLDARNNKLYALPYGMQTWNFWIRPDWFKEAGLEIPKTWDDVFEATKKLTDKNQGKYGLSIRGGSGSANTLEMLMYSYSGIQEYFTAEGNSTINDPLHVEFVEKYLGLYKEYTPEDDINKGWTELAATFQSGKTAMIVHNLGSASAHEKAFDGDRTKFASMVFPKNNKGYTQHPGFMPLGLSMSATTKNKDAAWKVITLYLSEEINTQYSKLYGEIPANKIAAKAEWMTQLPHLKQAVELISSSETKFGKVPYHIPAYSSIHSKIVETMIQKVMAKQITAKEMLDAWAKELEKEKAEYEKSMKK